MKTEELIKVFNSKVDYEKLGGKEQENYNFTKIAALLSEYGFSCNLITADKNGADVLAYHIKMGFTLQIQLKGSRATLNKKYLKAKEPLWIAYIDQASNELCLYDHAKAVKMFEKTSSAKSESWKIHGKYSGVNLNRKFENIIIRIKFSY